MGTSTLPAGTEAYHTRAPNYCQTMRSIVAALLIVPWVAKCDPWYRVLIERFAVPAARFGEARQPVVLGLVEDFPLLGDFNHSGLAEGTAQEILEQALEPLGIFRFHSDTLVHTKARVLLTVNIPHHLGGDFSLGQQELEDFLFPQLEKPFAGQFGQLQLNPHLSVLGVQA